MRAASDEELKAELANAVREADQLADRVLAVPRDPVFGRTLHSVSRPTVDRYAAAVAAGRAIQAELDRRRRARWQRYLWLQAAS